MSNLNETPVYDAGVYQLEESDPVKGGPDGEANKPLKNLANRTAYLKQHMDAIETLAASLAPKASPEFSGSPKSPTAALGDRNSVIANTTFVQDTIAGLLIKDIPGNGGAALTAVECGNGVLAFTGVLTGNAVVTVPNAKRKWIVVNLTTGNFSLTVKTVAGTGATVAQGRSRILWCDSTNVYSAITDFANTDLTGNSTASDVASGNASSAVANTRFVMNATDGMAQVNVTGNSAVVVPAAQYGCAILNLTGSLTGNINLILPSISGQWVIANNATGPFNITAKTAGGTGVVLPSGAAVLVYGDGVNIYLASTSGQASFKTQSYAPAAGTTVLPVIGGFSPFNVIVEKNKQWLKPSEFDSTTSPNIVLAAASTAGDTFTVHIFSSFSVTNALLRTGDSMLGPLLLQNPPDFDDSMLAAPTAWVNRHSMQFPRASGVSVNANATLTKAQVGRWIEISTDGVTATLPSLAGMHQGAMFSIRCVSASGFVKGNGSDQIISANGTSFNALLMARGESMVVVNNGPSWYVLGHSAKQQAGQVAYFPGNQPPPGWLKINGSLLSRTSYAELWGYAQSQGLVSEADWNASYSGRFSVGDGGTTFRLPDLRGMFLRVWDDGRNFDAGRNLGQYQADQNQSHAHGISDPGHAHGVYDPGHAHGAYTDVQGHHYHNNEVGSGFAYTGTDGVNNNGTAAGLTNNGAGFGNRWSSTPNTAYSGSHGHNVYINGAGTGIGIYGAGVGIGIQASGGAEVRVRNIAWPMFIKF